MDVSRTAGTQTLVIISADQIRSLRQAAFERFVARMADHLRQTFPDQTAASEPDRFRADVRAGIGIAMRYRLMRECDIEAYLNVLCASGCKLDQAPPQWAHEVLVDRDVPGGSIAAWLYRTYRNSLRE